jgi:hypothetical protein
MSNCSPPASLEAQRTQRGIDFYLDREKAIQVKPSATDAAGKKLD